MGLYDMTKLLSSIVICALISISACKKENVSTTPVSSTTYFPRVKTIIQNNCMSCHHSSGSWTGRPTKFDTDSDIVINHAAIKSSVADTPTFTNKRMPQGSTLPQSDIDLIVQWNQKGGRSSD